MVVYARVAPQHKLRVVKMLKRKGHIVAMTGGWGLMMPPQRLKKPILALVWGDKWY